MRLRGVGVSPGIGIGRVCCVPPPCLDYSGVSFSGGEAELGRLDQAVRQTAGQIRSRAEVVRRRAGADGAAILTGHAAMLLDPVLQGQLRAAVEEGRCAEAAVDSVYTTYIRLLGQVEDPVIRQRAADVRDIRNHLLAQLLQKGRRDLTCLPADTVLAAAELTPSMAASLAGGRVVAVVTEEGGRSGHAAILTRAMKIPVVLGVSGALERLEEGETAIVDGDQGEVYLDPTPEELSRYEQLRRSGNREEKF